MAGMRMLKRKDMLMAVGATSLSLALASGVAAHAQSGAAPSQANPSSAPPSPPAQKAAIPAGDNAFPEAQSEAAQKEANAAEKSAADGPASDSAGPDTDSSSSRSRLKGIDLLGDKDSPASNGAGGVVDNPQLAKEDVRIGQLYMTEGDYVGAYARFKEATEVGPGNADAVFFLAEAARKTAHLDEAAANYKLYLAADAKGKRAKDAKKALTELAGK